MIVSSCPLRVSLFGGSTDNPSFLQENGYGSVISFTANIKTYTTLFEDKLGFNNNSKKYIINYTIREEVSNYNDIKNELVRSAFKYFNFKPTSIDMHSDVYSQGSGLASSSSYLLNLINCFNIYNNKNVSDSEMCKLALDIEREFNPYCGLQDPYGCGIGGFKRMEFDREERVKITYLPTDFFEKYNMYLIFTGITRNSKNILKSISNNKEKILPLLKIVEQAHKAITDKDYITFLDLIKDSWITKKAISTDITEYNIIKDIDNSLDESKDVLAHKLCGAGNGGFFLAFSEKDSLDIPHPCIKINLSTHGVYPWGVRHKILI